MVACNPFARIISDMTLPVCFAILALLLSAGHAGADKPDLAGFLEQNCKHVEADHSFLVDFWLHQRWTHKQKFSAWEMVSTGFPDWFLPHSAGGGNPKALLFMLDNNLYLHPSLSEIGAHRNLPSHPNHLGNGAWHILPVLRHLLQKVNFPDFLASFNIWDEPVLAHLYYPFPFLDFCNVEMRENSLLLPISMNGPRFLGNKTHPRAGPGDQRERKACFLGSPTGWTNGRRKAIMRAGMAKPGMIYAGLTSIMDYMDAKDKETFNSTLQKGMSMPQQVDRFQYLIYADGHSASLRLDQMLYTDATVFMVSTPRWMWYFPLLVPFVHYVPVHFEPEFYTSTFGTNILGMHQWAYEHPAQIREISDRATDFADTHLSTHGLECYAVRLLLAYINKFVTGENLQDIFFEELRRYPSKQGDPHPV